MRKIISLLILLVICSPCLAELAGDFDNTDSVSTEDIAVLIAWIQESVFASRNQDYVVTLENVDQRAEGIIGRSINTSRLPAILKDDFNSSSLSEINTEDIAILIAYSMEKTFAERTGGTFSLSDVETRAETIWSLTSEVGKLPGTPIGDSSFSTTITGIQTD